MEGTYLAWINIEKTGKTSEQLCQELKEKAKVRLNPGTMYGTEGFVRVNLACSQGLLQRALIQIKKSEVLDVVK